MASVSVSSGQGAPATASQPATAQRRLPAFDWTIARVMAVLATLMLPAGIVAVLLGWYGAASTGFVFEQIPYLISGGLLGVGLLTAGGLLYVGSWVARLAEVQREEGEKTREALRAVRQELEYLPGLVGGGTTVTSQRTFVATRTGTMFHVPDCSVVGDRDDLRNVSADEPGLTPCKLCQPLATTT
jgi:hypothetical protein